MCKNLNYLMIWKTVARMIFSDFILDISYFIQQYSFLTLFFWAKMLKKRG